MLNKSLILKIFVAIPVAIPEGLCYFRWAIQGYFKIVYKEGLYEPAKQLQVSGIPAFESWDSPRHHRCVFLQISQ